MLQSLCSRLLGQGSGRCLQWARPLSTSTPLDSLHTAVKKRFYKEVSIVQSSGAWEVNLDQRKLKTPLGSPFKVGSEFLAQAVANEWRAQKDTILLSQMHINALVNTNLDNPGRLDKASLVSSILDFIETDTVLFYGDEPKELFQLQEERWGPLILWFRDRFQISLSPVVGISAPCLSPADRAKLERHLSSHSLQALHGIQFGVDATKSLILTLATMERRITVEEAVALTRLELVFQTDHWGRVEWAHDIEEHDTTARLAAATLFVQLSSGHYSSRAKNIQA